MNKIKKILVITLIVIVILTLIIFIRELILWNDGKLDKTSDMSREEVIELLKKGSNYTNYYYNPQQSPNVNNENLKTEYYIKDNIVAMYLNSNLLSWTDYNTGENISLIETEYNNVAGISYDAHLIENTQYGVDYSQIADTTRFYFEYKYLGEKNYDGRKVILIQLKNNNYYIKYIIDKDTGLILESIDLEKKSIITVNKVVTKQNIKLNIVTDENVKRPDLSTYKIKESE